MKKKSAKKHSSPATKVVKGTPQAGGNLKLKSPAQSIHVAQKKDNMAKNVGGSAAHMEAAGMWGPSQKMMYSGGKSGKKPKAGKDKR